MEVSGQMHVPAALLPRKISPMPVGWEIGRAADLDTVPQPRIEHRSSNKKHSHYTD